MTSELIDSRKFCSLLLASLLLVSILAMLSQVQSSAQSADSITITPPPDKTVTGTGSLTRVALGTPLVSGTTDPTPNVSHDAPGSTQIPSGAVAYWSFDNNSNDASGNENDLTPEGDAFRTSSYMGKALSLDGSGDYAMADDSRTLWLTGAFTISAWIKFDTLTPEGNYVRILEKGSSPGDKYWMFYVKSSKSVGFGFISSGTPVSILTSKTDWETGKWYHIVGTYNPAGGSNNMKIFVDGERDNAATKTGEPLENSEPLLIGTKSDASSEFWKGDIDEVRIYKRALWESEVTNLYNSPFVNLPSGINTITWTVTDDLGGSATATQLVTVVGPSTESPLTSLTINGKKYVDAVSDTTFVTSASAFALSVESSITIAETYYRYFKTSDSTKPGFSTGTYFKIIGEDGEYAVEFYSINTIGNKEPVRKKYVVLDEARPTTSLSVIDSSTGKVKLTAKDNAGGSGVGQRSSSGIYYKLDSAASYTFVRSDTVTLTDVANGAHTIKYYAVDNVDNEGYVKSTEFEGAVTYTFCSSGCDYNNLQTAINSLPEGGGKIFIKAGEYTMSNTIILKSGTTLEFSALANIYFTESKIVFKGSKVTDVKIIGGDITAKLGGVKALAFYNSKRISVDGTEAQLVKGSDSAGFYCNNCIDVSVVDAIFSSATRLVDIKDGDHVNGQSANILIQNGRFEDGSEICVKVNYSNNVRIIGNFVNKCNDNGIDIGSNNDSEIRDNVISNTGIPYGAAIHTDEANGALIINNHIWNTGEAAISIYRVSNIDFIGNKVKNSGGNAINVITTSEPSSNIKIKSNEIIAPGKNGVYVAPSQSQIVISNNTFEDVPADKQAIFVASPNTTTTVTGNTIT